MHYLFYKMRKEDICIVKFILEAYENLMTISTVDEELPKIQITVADDFVGECLEILEDLSKRFTLIRLDDPPHISQGNY